MNCLCPGQLFCRCKQFFPKVQPSACLTDPLLYNFVKNCAKNSQNEYKYTAIFGQLVICTLGFLYSRKPV